MKIVRFTSWEKVLRGKLKKRVHVSEFFFLFFAGAIVNVLTIQFLNSVRMNGLIMCKINVKNRFLQKVDFSFISVESMLLRQFPDKNVKRGLDLLFHCLG